MATSKLPSFVTEIPLKLSSLELAVLRKRFWAAKQQYNALLNECLVRLDAMRNDPRFEQAKVKYKNPQEKAEGTFLFKQLAREHGYSEYHLHAYCK